MLILKQLDQGHVSDFLPELFTINNAFTLGLHFKTV